MKGIVTRIKTCNKEKLREISFVFVFIALIGLVILDALSVLFLTLHIQGEMFLFIYLIVLFSLSVIPAVVLLEMSLKK